MPKQKQKSKQEDQEQQGLSAWIWGLIGAAVGAVGWIVLRLVSK